MNLVELREWCERSVLTYTEWTCPQWLDAEYLWMERERARRLRAVRLRNGLLPALALLHDGAKRSA